MNLKTLLYVMRWVLDLQGLKIVFAIYKIFQIFSILIYTSFSVYSKIRFDSDLFLTKKCHCFYVLVPFYFETNKS